MKTFPIKPIHVATAIALAAGDCVLSIAPPEPGKVRSRKVVTRSRARPTGKYPSWKMGRMLQWESVNERDAFRLLDADRFVLAFYEQPCTITFRLHGEVHTHYPDILVMSFLGPQLWEVKTAEEARRPEYRERTSLLCEQLPTFGYTYHVVIAEDLRRQPRLANVVEMLKLGRHPLSDMERERLRRSLEACHSLTWGEAIDGQLGRKGAATLARAFLEGKVSFDVNSTLARSTAFHAVQKAA